MKLKTRLLEWLLWSSLCSYEAPLLVDYRALFVSAPNEPSQAPPSPARGDHGEENGLQKLESSSAARLS